MLPSLSKLSDDDDDVDPDIPVFVFKSAITNTTRL